MNTIKMRDVATAAGVSIPTVSQVLNGNGAEIQLSTSTIKRVEQIARDLGYVHNAVARNLRAQRTGQIGVILSGFQDKGIPPEVRLSLEGAFLLGLTEAARKHGVPGVVIYPTDPTQPLDSKRFLDRRVDGLIVQNDPWGVNLLRDLDPERVPTVGVWTQEVRDGAGYADVDHVGGVVQAVGHLVELGHRRIALLGPPLEKVSSNENFRRRYEGYWQALKEAGIKVEPNWHVGEPHEVLDLMNAPEPITAVFAVNDRRAISLVRAVTEAGLRVPQDLSIVGFDNAIGTDLVAGGLTTVNNPALEVSAAALENLMALIEGTNYAHCRTVVPTKLVIRNSTAKPKGTQ
jgi:LacI family transcriptional regulator